MVIFHSYVNVYQRVGRNPSFWRYPESEKMEFGPKKRCQCIAGWWLSHPSEKYEFVNGKIKTMFQTTNQIVYIDMYPLVN